MPRIRSTPARLLFMVTLSALTACAAMDSASLAGGRGLDPSPPAADASGAPPGFGGDDAGGAPPPHLFVVHASPDLFAFRVCFATGGSDAEVGTFTNDLPAPADPSRPMPLSNYPGVPSGAGVELVDLPASARGTVVPYVVDARRVWHDWATDGCDALFEHPRDFRENVEYFALPPITLHEGATAVLVVSGCVPALFDKKASAARCGATYDEAKGNLTATLTPLAMASPKSDAMSVHFAQLSASAGAVRASFGTLAADAGAIALTDGQAYLADPAAPVDVPLPHDDAGALLRYSTEGVTVEAADDGGVLLATDLATIQRLSSPSDVPSTFFARGAYLFALVGDATDPDRQLTLPDGGANPTFDGTGLHVIAVPLGDGAPH